MPALTLTAPAKVNLTLEVLGRRADGYHEVRSLMQAVSVCDLLTFSEAPGLTYSCDLPGWDSGKSLVSRAAELLLAESGCRRGAAVNITKSIPLSSGLGGDSSDGAATLLGLNDLWRLGMPHSRLSELASGLGSDVDFFLTGGTALAQGRGEIISPLPSPGPLCFVILVPDFTLPGNKTAALYARLGKEAYTGGEHTRALLSRLASGLGVGHAHLFNVFESVAFDVFPGLDRCRQALLSAGATRVHLAGAGPALFSLHKSPEEAAAVCGRVSGWPVFLAEAVNGGHNRHG